MRENLIITLAAVVLGLFLAGLVWTSLNASHRCQQSGGVYTRDHGCLHKEDIPR